MKKLIFLILFTACAIAARSQTLNQGGYTGVYKWSDVVLMQPCDVQGNLINNIPVQYSIVGSKFTVCNVKNGLVTIKMYDYTIKDSDYAKLNDKAKALPDGMKLFDAKELFYKYNFSGSHADYKNLPAIDVNTRNYGKFQIYFCVAQSVFLQKAQKITKIAESFNLGAINFPFKYRFTSGKSDFTGAFNLGAAIGYELKHDSLKKFTYTIPFAVSISNVNLDATSALSNQDMLKSTNNFAALSMASGIIVENNKIQVGVFVGFDKISSLNNKEYNWIYQNKPWISIGFGYSLFSSEKPATSGATDTQQTTTQ